MFTGPTLAQPTITNLGVLSGGTHSNGGGISADGLVVTEASGSSAGTRAFRWPAAHGMQNLCVIAGFTTSSYGYAISADGAVVTGASYAPGQALARAFRWTASTGMQSIGVLGTGWASYGFAISGDGSVIEGMGRSTVTGC